MKIGIYGGSFDPIHSGHAIVANFVSQCNVVDEVWIMVSRKNPIKPHDTYATDTDRLAMARLVSQECRNVNVTAIEMSLPVPSYTYDTLLELKRQYPEHEFHIIIGSDSVMNFPKWRNYERIQKEFGVIVYPRPGYPLPEDEPSGMTFLNGAPEFGISSSLIREYIASGWDINFFVPPAVCEYIEKNNLYR